MGLEGGVTSRNEWVANSGEKDQWRSEEAWRLAQMLKKW